MSTDGDVRSSSPLCPCASPNPPAPFLSVIPAQFIFGFFSTFSDPNTRRKFQMVGPQPAATGALLKLIDLEQLPDRWAVTQVWRHTCDMCDPT